MLRGNGSNHRLGRWPWIAAATAAIAVAAWWLTHPSDPVRVVVRLVDRETGIRLRGATLQWWPADHPELHLVTESPEPGTFVFDTPPVPLTVQTVPAPDDFASWTWTPAAGEERSLSTRITALRQARFARAGDSVLHALAYFSDPGDLGQPTRDRQVLAAMGSDELHEELSGWQAFLAQGGDRALVEKRVWSLYLSRLLPSRMRPDVATFYWRELRTVAQARADAGALTMCREQLASLGWRDQ